MKAEDNRRILAIGAGGAGIRIINRMIGKRMEGMEFAGIDADRQSLKLCRASERLYIGEEACAGADGRKAELSHGGRIWEALDGARMVFLFCGAGGCTGMEAACAVAELAKEKGIFTAAIVTSPFYFEGTVCMQRAAGNLRRLRTKADSVTIVSNDAAFLDMDWNSSIREALQKADDVICQMVWHIVKYRNAYGMIYVDMEDIQEIMKGPGITYIGIGEGRGEDRIEEAVREAMQSRWQSHKLCGADRAAVLIEGNVNLLEADNLCVRISEWAAEGARVISALNWEESDRCTVVVIAGGTGNFEDGPGGAEEDDTELLLQIPEGLFVLLEEKSNGK